MMIGCQSIAFGQIFTPPVHVVGKLIRICSISLCLASSLDGVKFPNWEKTPMFLRTKIDLMFFCKQGFEHRDQQSDFAPQASHQPRAGQKKRHILRMSHAMWNIQIRNI
jgi:hypothetical protein